MDTGRYALALVLVDTAAAGWWVNDWLKAGAPVLDAFYYPAADVPAGQGRLIRTDTYPGEFPDNGTVQRILYTTRDSHGDPAVASGLGFAPPTRRRGPVRW